MTQVNLSTKQKQTHRHKEQTCGCRRGGEVGEGRIGSLGLAESLCCTAEINTIL